jgi:hypothetical protein
MTDSLSPEPPTNSEVSELLERRATIERWLARLDDYGTEVSARVTERVRGDYEARLREVLEQLGSRQEAVRAELDARLRELARAEDEHAAARESLEENLLRQRIGEISPDEWSERRPELENAVAEALERLEGLRAETARLERVLADIVAPVPDHGAARPVAGAPPLPESAPIPIAEIALEPDFILEADTIPEPGVAPGNDLFLEELDRAIASPSRPGMPSPLDVAETAPRHGTKCPECGYTNDVGAWYCGVCGVDLT